MSRTRRMLRMVPDSGDNRNPLLRRLRASTCDDAVHVVRDFRDLQSVEVNGHAPTASPLHSTSTS